MKKQKKALETRKSRDAKRKRKRLVRQALMNQVGAQRKRMKSDAPVTALKVEDEILIGVKKGTFGHPGTVVLRVDDTALVGMVEDRAELAKFVNNVGILVTSQLFRHNLAEGVDGLAKSVAKWAGVDLEALRKAAEEELAEQKATEGQSAEAPASQQAEVSQEEVQQ